MFSGFEHTPRLPAPAAPTIVVAEDERIAAEDLRRRLESWGYRVQAVVASGEEAIRVAEAIRPDLLLMDVRLKGTIDGVEAARRIRARLNIPVIYAASLTDPVTVQRAQLSDPSGFISKPYDDNEMRFTIATALARRAMDRQVAEAEERYRRLAAMSADMVLLLQRGRIINANNAAVTTLGYPLNDLLRIDPIRLTAPESTLTLKLVLQEIADGISHSAIETTVLTRLGSPLTVVLSGESCIVGGEPASLIVMTDITRGAAAEADAARFAEELFDAKAEADERGIELTQAHRELAMLRDAMAEERRAQRGERAKWAEEVRACAATVQSCLSACGEHVSSPEHRHLLDEIGRAIRTLQQAIAADQAQGTPEPAEVARAIPRRQNSPGLAGFRMPL